jgi:peptidoglycan hydrolase-like protein with peptidoglycan-binding domain
MKKIFSGLLLVASFSFVSAAVNPPDLGVSLTSASEEIISLQKFLTTEGLYSGPTEGFFGAVTESAVKEFQKKKGLPVTGIVDCATRAYIPTVAPCSGTVSSGGQTATLSATDSWFQQNCLPQPVGLEEGRITPMVYAPSGAGGTDIAQIGKPFNLTITGVSSTTIGARVTASDANVTITPSTCTNGNAVGAMGCSITVSGEARDVYLKVHNARTGIKPICRKVTVYRAPVAYTVGLSIDKNAFGSGEAFKVTLTGDKGFSRANAQDINGPIVFTRSNAPAGSCESRLDMGICQADGVITCAMLPGSTAIEYLCAATMLDMSGTLRSHNKTSDVTYTAHFKNRNSIFDTFTFDGRTDSIKLYKQGTNNDGGMTAYGGCPAGEGVDPRYPQNGCTRCQNIVNTYRSHISTCNTTGQDTFTWRYVRQATAFDQWPACAPKREGDVCTDSAAYCVDGSRLLSCTNTNPTVTGSYYHGKVLDASTNAPLAGVSVKAGHPTAFYLGTTCPTAITDATGEYRFTVEQSKSTCFGLASAWVEFTKEGYTKGSAPSGNEFDKLIPTFRMQRAGTPTTPAGPGELSFDAPVKTMNGNTVTFTLSNAESGQVDVCYQVINHPTVPSLNTPESTPCSPWTNNWTATGNAEWRFNATNKTLVGTFPANATWNIPGLVVRSSFRKSGTNQVVTAKMIVAGGSYQVAALKTPDNNASLVLQARPLNQATDAGVPACKKETLPTLGTACATQGPVCVGANVGQTPAVPVTVVCETLSIEQKSLEITLAGVVLQAIDNNVFDGQGQAWIRENIPGAAELLDLRQTIIDTVVDTVTTTVGDVIDGIGDVIDDIGDAIGDAIDDIGNAIDDLFGGGNDNDGNNLGDPDGGFPEDIDGTGVSPYEDGDGQTPDTGSQPQPIDNGDRVDSPGNSGGDGGGDTGGGSRRLWDDDEDAGDPNAE